MNTVRSVLTVASLLLAPAVFAQPASEPGKQLLDRTCTACHTIDTVMDQRNTKDRWSQVVDDMVSRGAQASDADLTRIVDYLGKIRAPKISVNTLNAADLTDASGLPKDSAAAIVDYRDKHGAFKNLDELKQAPGVDAAAIDKKKDLFDFSNGK
jgi:competence protein ComEA